MQRSEIAQQVRVEVETLLQSPIDFDDGESLADQGIDSLRSVQLTLNLEDTFGIVFEDDEISPTHLSTIDSITNLVEKKLAV